jgi:hypothetical protein
MHIPPLKLQETRIVSTPGSPFDRMRSEDMNEMAVLVEVKKKDEVI